MNNWLLEHKELISVYVSILGTVFTIFGAIAIPVALWFLSNRDQKRKEEQLQRKEEKDFLLNYVREELIPLRITPDKPQLLNNKEEIRKQLLLLSSKLADFNSIMRYSSFSYMCEYLNFLNSFIWKIIRNEKLSLKDLYEAFCGFSTSITFMQQLVLMKQDDYKKVVPTGIIILFMDCSENVKNIMLVALKEIYPEYYDTIVKDIEDEKNKIVKMETINE